MAALDKWLTGLPADASVADAARVAILSRAAEVSRHLPLAALQPEEDIEYVHRLRVNTRRSSAVLKVFKQVYPDKHANRLDWLLRKVRRAAGPARDLDVFLDRMTKEHAPKGVLARLLRQRDAVQAGLQQVHDKLDGGHKIDRRLEKLTLKTPAKGKASKRLAATPLADWAPGRFDSVAKRFVRTLPEAGAPAAQLHQFRIECKRLRYAIEALSPGLPEMIRTEGYPLLKALQDQLGSINDHATAAVRLAEWMAEAKKSEREFLDGLIAREQKLRKREMQDFADSWNSDQELTLLSALGLAC